MSKYKKVEAGLENLLKDGGLMVVDLELSNAEPFLKNYQPWYSEAQAFVSQILPYRLEEFSSLYEGENDKKGGHFEDYSIRDFFLGKAAPHHSSMSVGSSHGVKSFGGGKKFDEWKPVLSRFKIQLGIVQAGKSRLQSSLFDIQTLVQADLFDSELEAAQEFLKNGFIRPAGVLAGIVLEKHLSQVAENHNIQTKKKGKTVAAFNDALKEAGILDTAKWRQISFLGDVRNKCAHANEKEPIMDEVEDLISIAARLLKTLS